jgi:hypothetical protein
MRTTLDIDSDVLQAAKEIAAARRQTAGKVLSELARAALKSPSLAPAGMGEPFVMEDGWYVLPNRSGIVTNELVQRLVDEADWEDAGLSDDLKRK